MLYKSRRLKATILTMRIGLINTILLIIYNLIYTRLLLLHYGSDTNGLISTVTQFASFFSILDGGVSTAVVVAAVDAINKKQYELLGGILYTTRVFFGKTSLLILIIGFPSAFLYSLFVKTEISYTYVLLLLMVSVLNVSISVYGMTRYSILLQASNKVYIINEISLVAKTVTWIASIVLICLDENIVIVYALNSINLFLNIFLMREYEKKNYPFVSYLKTKQSELLRKTSHILFQKIANVIFGYTDLLVASIMISTNAASIYNVYALVYSSVMTLTSVIINAPFISISELYAEGNEDEINEKYNLFPMITRVLSDIIFTTTLILAPAFIRLYTRNINDCNYTLPIVNVLFYLFYYIRINNTPYGLMINAAGRFSLQNSQCVIGTVINIVISIMFIQYLGIVSIVLGSVVGCFIILFGNMMATQTRIIPIDLWMNIIKYTIHCSISIFIESFFRKFMDNIDSYWLLIVYGIEILLLCFVIFGVLTYAEDKNRIRKFINMYLMTKKKE